MTPAAFTIWFAGDKATYQLLILSQVILSMQLPFAVIPLIHFTSDRERMGAFANKAWVRMLAWLTAAIIIALNMRLAGMAIADWLAAAGEWKTAGAGSRWFRSRRGFLLLLVWVTLEPLMSRWTRKYGRAPVELPEPEGAEIAAPVYHRILVPLDHTGAGPAGGEPRRRHGQALRRPHLPAARGGRRDQPGVRPGVIHGGSGTGRAIPGADRAIPAGSGS